MNFIKSIIARFRPATSTASILSGFTKTIEKLEDHALSTEAEVRLVNEQIDASMIKRNELDVEAGAARKAAGRLSMLLD